MRNNALWNCKNPYQGDAKRVLCVCSAGLLRSPTIASILNKQGYNTRAAGVHDYALVELDEVLIEWADKIIFADQSHLDACNTVFPDILEDKEYVVLGIPDIYGYNDPKLVKIIEDKLKEIKFD